MNTGNLALLTLFFTICLLALQRTERRRRWLTALVLVLPVSYLLYRWALYRGQVKETLIGAGIALALNLLFWLFHGRRHPPLSSDDSIRVIGTDE
jgi:formate hydrogenlyase subunit 3/multisubunit Na+/H+ antiporter MnhD subunit